MKEPLFYTGEPVEPCDLMFRDDFIDIVWESLRQRHVLIAAPRRTGKTSVMNHLMEYPRHSFLVVSQNVQDFDHPAGLFQSLLENLYELHNSVAERLIRGGWSLLKESRQWLGRNVESVGAGSFKIALRNTDPDWNANWKQHADETLRQLRSIGQPMLLIINELPDLILNMRRHHEADLRDFLGWFRKIRQDPPPSRDTIRWLIGGSTNIASTLDELGEVDLINDIAEEPLPVLSEEQVREFVQRMLSCRGVDFSQTVPRRISVRLGRPIPFFMQLVTQEVFRSWRREPRKITTRDVDEIFDGMVTSQASQGKLQHYHSRISRYYLEPRQSAAYLLLSKLSLASDQGISRRALQQLFLQHCSERGETSDSASMRSQFNHLMRDLENDFYVSECSKDQFDFSSGVMKSWWRKYYG